MESTLLSISKIFSERLFRIPDYQRGYSWGEKQLKDFWSDLEKLQENQNHYTGVLTLESVPGNIYDRWDDDKWIITSKKYEPFFIVDEQQRLTTIIILIQTILENTQEYEIINYTERKDIQKKFIFDSKDGEISRSYIFGYEKDNPSYNFLKKTIFLERINDRIEDTIYTQNLEKAKKFFKHKLEKYTFSLKEKLYTKVTQCLLFNIFKISNAVDVCIAFETMNNRGKPLSYLELLKNRLIYVSTQLTCPDHEKRKLRENINACWKVIYHNLGRNKNKPLSDDLFLMTHSNIYFYKLAKDEYGYDDVVFSSKFGRNAEEYSRFLLERIFNQRNINSASNNKDFEMTIKSIDEYVQSMKEIVEIWYDILNPEHSSHSENIKSILINLNHMDIGTDKLIATVLILMRDMKKQNFIESSLKEIERLMFVKQTVSRHYYPYKNYEAKCLAVAMSLQEEKNFDEQGISKKIRQISDSIIKKGDFSKSLLDSLKWAGGFYNWNIIRYVLFEYEVFLEKQTKTSISKIIWEEYSPWDKEENIDLKFNMFKPKSISVEHIYPQHARHKYWTERFSSFNQNQKAALRNSIGNLLPLSQRKNSALSNKPFPEKVLGEQNTKQKNYVGYQFGSYSEIDVSQEKEWNADTILKRGVLILNFMEKRWDLKFGSEHNKKYLLGLKFL